MKQSTTKTKLPTPAQEKKETPAYEAKQHSKAFLSAALRKKGKGELSGL